MVTFANCLIVGAGDGWVKRFEGQDTTWVQTGIRQLRPPECRNMFNIPLIVIQIYFSAEVKLLGKVTGLSLAADRQTALAATAEGRLYSYALYFLLSSYSMFSFY